MHSATEQLAAEKSLQNCQWLPSVPGDLLAKMGQTVEVRVHLEQAGQAAAQAFNLRARKLLLEWVRDMLNPHDSGSSLKRPASPRKTCVSSYKDNSNTILP